MWNTIKERLSSPDAFVSMILGFAAVLVVGVVIVNMLVGPKTRVGQTNVPGESTASAERILPATYTVQSGDSLWTIAEMYYKSGYNWVTIRDANHLTTPDSIAVGLVLTLPKASPIEVGQIGTGTSTQRITPKQTTYSVAAGDSLWTIAETQYGTGYAWTAIASGNRLLHPDSIYPGTTLTLPAYDTP